MTRLFSFVCDPGLWPGLGRDMVEDRRSTHSETAFEIWGAMAGDARDWLVSGMSDAALMPDPVIGVDIAHRTLPDDRLIQVSTAPRAVMAWDPDYIFVDYGLAFRGWHTETWPGDETARMSFSNPDWALDHLLVHGGSAYLPERIVTGALAEGRLYTIKGAPEFNRRAVLSWRKAAEDQFSRLSPRS